MLEYSIVKNAILFCYACRWFAHGSSKAEDRFVCLGYNDWKHATGKGEAFLKHDNSQHHKVAFLNWTQYMASATSGTSVASSLDTVRKEQIEKNHHYL